MYAQSHYGTVSNIYNFPLVVLLAMAVLKALVMSTQPENCVNLVRSFNETVATSTNTQSSHHSIQNYCLPAAAQFNRAATANIVKTTCMDLLIHFKAIALE